MPKRSKTSRKGTSVVVLPTVIRAGSTIRPLHGDDYHVWLVCFHSSIAGLIAAHRKLPNPLSVIRYCTSVADLGVTAARARRKR